MLEYMLVLKVLTDGEVKEAFTANGNGILVISYITPDGAEASVVYIDGDPAGEALHFDGKVVRVQSINGYVTAQFENGEIDVITPDGDFYIYRTPEISGFSAVDADREGVYFVDRNRKVKKVITVNTRDRGTVYSVEDVN